MNEKHQYLIIIQGSNFKFFYEEFKSLFKLYFENETFSLNKIKNTLYKLDTSFQLPSKDHEFFSRITLTKGVFELLASGSEFDALLENLHIRPHLYSDSFAVDQISIKTKPNISNSTLAFPVGKQLNHMRANLKQPKHLFCYIFTPDAIYFTHSIFQNTKTYLKRMPVKRAVNKPYTLKSDMSRACINLLQVKSDEYVLDPFCGIGGIILEGLDMNMKMIGNDINAKDLEHTKTNCNHFQLSKPQLYNCDATSQFLDFNSIDGIVSDIPYGRSSRKLGVDLYEGFLQSAQKMLKKDKRMVIIYGCFTNFKPIAVKYFEEVGEIEQYMNSSLTRYILILKNSKKEI